MALGCAAFDAELVTLGAREDGRASAVLPALIRHQRGVQPE
jgi:hypothetical protein